MSIYYYKIDYENNSVIILSASYNNLYTWLNGFVIAALPKLLPLFMKLITCRGMQHALAFHCVKLYVNFVLEINYINKYFISVDTNNEPEELLCLF